MIQNSGPANQPTRTEDPKATGDTDPNGTGNGDGISAEEKAYWANQTRLANEAAASDREGAKAFLQNLLSTYGLGSLAGTVDSLVGQWGSNTDVIAVKLKDTSEYKQRFKGLLALQTKGVNDIANEGQYLQLESQYRQAFRDAGINDFLGTAGTQSEYDAIADLVGKYSVSVDEVKYRIGDAQRVVAETPAEVRNALSRYYNVDAGTLVSYVLDPARGRDRINTMANAAIVGGYAEKAGLNDLGSSAAELIATSQAGGNDLNGAALSDTLNTAAQLRNTTGRLAALEGDTLSADEAALASLNLDNKAKEKVRGLQSRERGRFGGASGVSGASLSGSPAL